MILTPTQLAELRENLLITGGGFNCYGISSGDLLETAEWLYREREGQKGEA